MTYDPNADALAIRLREGAKRPKTVEVASGVYLDFDVDGRCVGLELLDASFHIPRDQLDQLPTGEQMLTLREAAALTTEEGDPISEVTLRGQIHKGRIPGVKRGRDWLVSKAALITYLETRVVGRPPRSKPEARFRDPALTPDDGAKTHLDSRLRRPAKKERGLVKSAARRARKTR